MKHPKFILIIDADKDFLSIGGHQNETSKEWTFSKVVSMPHEQKRGFIRFLQNEYGFNPPKKVEKQINIIFESGKKIVIPSWFLCRGTPDDEAKTKIDAVLSKVIEEMKKTMYQ